MAEIDVLTWPQIDIQAGNIVQALLQVGDDRFHVGPALVWIQVDPKPAGVLRFHAGQVALHPRNGREDFIYLFAVSDHAVEGVILRGFEGSVEVGHVCRGHEALGHDDEKEDGERSHRDADEEGRAPMAKDDIERTAIGFLQRGVEAFRTLPEPIPRCLPRAEEAAAQHWSERERGEAGDQYRNRDRHRKLAQQAPQHSVEKDDGQKDGDQGNGHGNDGEANLAGAIDCRLHARLAHLAMAHDVLDHHDRVVDDEADRESNGHHGKHVHGIAEHPHRNE